MKRTLLLLLLSGLAQAKEPLLELGRWLPAGVREVRVSADGQRLLSLPSYYEDSERALELWRVSDGQRLAELHAPAQHISAGFLPGGQLVAALIETYENASSLSRGYVWDADGQVKVKHNALSGELPEPLLELAKDTLTLSTWENKESGDANGRDLWSEGQVKSWHWPTGKTRVLSSIRARIRKSGVSSDGHWVAVLGGDTQWSLWDARSGKRAAKKFSVSDFSFSSRPDTVRLDQVIYGLPSLTRVGKIPPMVTAVSGTYLYRLQPGPAQVLDGRTFQPLRAAHLQISPGFKLADSRAAGALQGGRVLLWDPVHRASALLKP